MAGGVGSWSVDLGPALAQLVPTPSPLQSQPACILSTTPQTLPPPIHPPTHPPTHPSPAGFVVAVPAVYFASRGMVNAPLGARLSLLFLMGGMQGLVGWWMVRSGFRVSGCSAPHVFIM